MLNDDFYEVYLALHCPASLSSIASIHIKFAIFISSNKLVVKLLYCTAASFSLVVLFAVLLLFFCA